MLIKSTHRAPDRRHATQISPGSCVEKQIMINKTRVVQAQDVISQTWLQLPRSRIPLWAKRKAKSMLFRILTREAANKMISIAELAIGAKKKRKKNQL